LSGARPFRSAAPNRSFEALVFVADFNGLGMFFHVLRVIWRGESVSLTMPRMSLKSDRTWLGGEGAFLGASLVWEQVSLGVSLDQAREVRNTMTVNSAMAATAINDPTIGAAMKVAPFRITIATPAGNRIAPAI
jgi:hypothetical protein